MSTQDGIYFKAIPTFKIVIFIVRNDILKSPCQEIFYVNDTTLRIWCVNNYKAAVLDSGVSTTPWSI